MELLWSFLKEKFELWGPVSSYSEGFELKNWIGLKDIVTNKLDCILVKSSERELEKISCEVVIDLYADPAAFEWWLEVQNAYSFILTKEAE